jgi:hypothetical protein
VGEAKCEFSKTEIPFYGMIISKDGIRPFSLLTDNKSMVYILDAKADAKKRTPLRLVHWKARLVRYNFEAIHVPGEDNIADYLSRCLNLHPFHSPSSKSHAQAIDEVESKCAKTIRMLESKSTSIAESLKQPKQT